MDLADAAQADQERAMARFEQSRPAAVDLPSQTECIYCEGDIPEPRRKHIPGVETCVECQRLIEQGVRL